MTLLILFCDFSKRDLLVLIMASNAIKEKNSISLSHEILDRQPGWSRCSSFSSSSNDSAVYCNNRHDSSFALGKRKERPSRVIQRNRNSSGSSASSSMSYFSDKDSKKASILTSMPMVGNVDDLEGLSCPSIGTSTFELQHETLVNDGLSCGERSDSALPFRRHNLRRNIRKKTCSCDCTATCTTLVVRRYKEIGRKTVEEETVISRTKVQTCVKNNATQELHKVTYEQSYSPSKSDGNRKRRSEVEKLYDSLHEIEWAKNFSPDNILRQIHIRQAASCSMFGRSSAKPSESRPRFAKRQKQDVKSNSSEGSLKRETPKRTPQTSRSTRSSTLRNRSQCNQNVDSASEAVGYRRRNPQRNEGTHSCIDLSKKQNHQNENSNESNLTESSVEHFELKKNLGKLNNKKHINVQNSSMDCKLISNTAESISKSTQIRNNFELPNSIAINPNTVIPKTYHLNGGSEVDDVELTTTEYLPTFFGIAEEGICTIDACFREVGAEVVISTCYEADSDLPLLTSVKDGNTSDKLPVVDDCPPVLEPCVSYQVPKAEDSDGFKGCQLENEIGCLIGPCEGLFSNGFCEADFLNGIPGVECDSTETSEMSMHKESSDSDDRSVLSEEKCSVGKETRNRDFSEILSEEKCAVEKETTNTDFAEILSKEKCAVEKETPNRGVSEILKRIIRSRCTNNSLIKNIGKRILNKYLRILRTKSSNGVAVKQFYISKKDFSSPVKIKNSSPELSTRDADRSRTLKAENIGSRTVVKTSNQIVYFCQSPKKLTFNHSKSSSYTYRSCNRESVSNVTTKNVTNKSLEIVQESNFNFRMEQTSVATTHLTERREYQKISVPCVPTNSAIEGPSCNVCARYQSIAVYRSTDYTQVILQLTHGTSSYFTVESLLELTDVLLQTGRDSKCPSLILNGIGESFSMGLDLRPLLGPHRERDSKRMAVAVKDFIEALSAFKKPLVAVVNGATHGLGMTVLNHADSIIASEKATFCMPQSRFGYFPEGAATFTLPRAVGSTVAMDLIVRGRVITAHEALSIGLISEVYEEKHLPLDIIARVRDFSKNTLSSMETTKAMLKMHLHAELLTVLENEVKLLPQMWLSDSCQRTLKKEIPCSAHLTPYEECQA